MLVQVLPFMFYRCHISPICFRKHLIDVYGTWGETALIKASRQGKADIVDYLLKSGADVDKVSGGTGRTALMVAIIHGHLEVVVLLNGKGCDWSIRDR
jgi:FOG: Ankyrin repeat